MRKLLNAMGKSAIKTMVRIGFAWPIAWLCAREIRALNGSSNGAEKPIINALALSPDRFRGDLQILDSSDRVKVWLMPIKWQFRLRAIFLATESERAEIQIEIGEDWLDDETRKEYLEFMKHFLRALYAIIPIDCVLGASYWYKHDRVFGEASDKIGHPYIVLHKENLRTETPQLEGEAVVARRVGRFGGSNIIVHNEIIRDVLVDCGFADRSQVVSLGCLRMDGFLSRLENYEPSNDKNKRKCVTYFSFSSGIGLKDLEIDPWSKHPFLGWNRLFELSHVEFARLARKMPEVDFVIKPKWGGEWIEKIHAALEANGIDAGELPNLSIQVGGDAQQLMFDSEVICGFGSTTILEAGLVGKPVVIPHFEEVNRKPYSEHVLLREHYDLYDVAKSPESFANLIVERLGNPFIDEEISVKRQKAFEKWISPLDAAATERYLELLTEVTSRNIECAEDPN